MAYCKNCGAYIPDGHTKCLACGLEQDKEENKGHASGSATQTDPREASRRSNEEMRRRLEEQRKRRQEENRNWAEAERRRQQRQQEERNRSSAGGGEEYYQRDNGSRPKGYQSNRLLAALSYLWILFLLPFIFCRDDKFALYHARQGLVLFAVTTAGQVLGAAFGLSWIVILMQIYWIIKGIGNANAGKMEPLPYIGNIFFKDK